MIKTSVHCDTFNMVGIMPYNRKDHEKQVKDIKLQAKSIEHQISSDAKDKVTGLAESLLDIVTHYEMEQQSLVNYERIFPFKQNAKHYSKLFYHKRTSNEMLMKYIQMK